MAFFQQLFINPRLMACKQQAWLQRRRIGSPGGVFCLCIKPGLRTVISSAYSRFNRLKFQGFTFGPYYLYW